MIIIDPTIKRNLDTIYNLDIDANVQNKISVKTLFFEFPRINFLEEIFIDFFENIDAQYIYLTKGYKIEEDENYFRLSKEKFIEFVKTNKTYLLDDIKHNIDTYYYFGIMIFDESFTWLIHKNPDEGDITFSYQKEKFTNQEEIVKLIDNKWFSE